VRLIAKSNGGQLSAFNAGFAAATGDVVCFLDADDELTPGYLAAVLGIYETRSEVDFVFTSVLEVRADGATKQRPRGRRSIDFGCTAIRTLILGDWVGSPTSAISLRTSLLRQILPSPLEASWRTSADDVLVLGAALRGGRKYFLAEPLVRYHVHDSNLFYGRGDSDHQSHRRTLRRWQLVGHLAADLAAGLAHQACLGKQIVREFTTLPAPDRSSVTTYWRVVQRARCRFRWWRKLQILWLWLRRARQPG
jgi:glycosyltransferase involved in cell wall biosynthesis